MNTPLITSEIRTEADVVLVRQRARQIAAILQFDSHEQTRIATAVSEIARNAFLYAGGGRAQFSIEDEAPERFVISISDSGPGILNLPTILAGIYKSGTGMGLGLLGARKLMDTFRAESIESQGTTIELGKQLPRQVGKVTPQFLVQLGAELAKLAPTSPMEEIRQQNIELVRVLDELRSRQRELDHTHRQVASANTQLEEKAAALEHTVASEHAARAEAEAAVETRDLLLAIVSHDLRSPLSAIVNNAVIIQRTPVEGAQGGRLNNSAQTILRSADRMTRLIADLLDLAQIQAGKLAVEASLQDAEEIIRESIETLRPLATTRDLTLDGGATVGLQVHCDRERVLQILSNLVGNALKFTPKGGSISIAARGGEHETQFFVRDTGAGISAEELPHIFDRFWQAQRKERVGIGLGLSIVKGLVEAHGGRLWAESKVGVGTTFFFTLAFAALQSADVQSSSDAAPSVAATKLAD